MYQCRLKARRVRDVTIICSRLQLTFSSLRILCVSVHHCCGINEKRQAASNIYLQQRVQPIVRCHRHPPRISLIVVVISRPLACSQISCCLATSRGYRYQFCRADAASSRRPIFIMALRVFDTTVSLASRIVYIVLIRACSVTDSCFLTSRRLALQAPPTSLNPSLLIAPTSARYCVSSRSMPASTRCGWASIWKTAFNTASRKSPSSVAERYHWAQ